MNDIIAVKFKEGRVYRGIERYYRTLTPVHVGDLVVVNTAYPDMDLSVALVTSTNVDVLFSDELDYIVDVVDILGYVGNKNSEDRIIYLKSQMDRMFKSIKETSAYEALAKENEEFRELYLEYKQELEKLR